MDFHDFPMILRNLGVETDHPPKMCAGLPVRSEFEEAWVQMDRWTRNAILCLHNIRRPEKTIRVTEAHTAQAAR